jgi:hypothetical protein
VRPDSPVGDAALTVGDELVEDPRRAERELHLGAASSGLSLSACSSVASVA